MNFSPNSKQIKSTIIPQTADNDNARIPDNRHCMLNNQVKLLKEKLADYPLGKSVIHFLDYMSVEAGLSPNTLLGYGRDLT
jgi:hypothetical protein